MKNAGFNNMEIFSHTPGVSSAKQMKFSAALFTLEDSNGAVIKMKYIVRSSSAFSGNKSEIYCRNQINFPVYITYPLPFEFIMARID